MMSRVVPRRVTASAAGPVVAASEQAFPAAPRYLSVIARVVPRDAAPEPPESPLTPPVSLPLAG